MPLPFAFGGLILVLDTCGERASLALFRGAVLMEEIHLPERTASAALLGALRSLLAGHGVGVENLAAIGVVSGPGSFTGVRVGLAMAKGLCEATGFPMAAVSRLAVLADAAGLSDGFALLPAGRGQVFALQIETKTTVGREWLTSVDPFAESLRGDDVAVTSPQLAEVLGNNASVRLVELSARDAIGAVLRCLSEGGSDVNQSDANYVRNEEEIYRKALGDPAGSAH